MSLKYRSAAWRERLKSLKTAALDARPVSGLTHRFYRYPARFSPSFAAAAIEAFSKPGDIVLDPYMGGGTTVVEALVRGRKAVGCDVNSLAVFISHVKATPMGKADRLSVSEWARRVIPSLNYSRAPRNLADVLCEQQTRNLQLPSARPLKKLLALALLTLDDLPNATTRDFARCILLNAGQWALNGRRSPVQLVEFRQRLHDTVREMLAGNAELEGLLEATAASSGPPILINESAAHLPKQHPFSSGVRARLVVTSPPYPGIHVLYHRWQIDGRRETPAPYWLAARRDGSGESFYNFADRRDASGDGYFARLLETMNGIRGVMEIGAVIVQLVAFGNPRRHLVRYLKVMASAGFEELRTDEHFGEKVHRRIWRPVPGRTWHAAIKGQLPSSREVVLIHRAQ